MKKSKTIPRLEPVRGVFYLTRRRGALEKVSDEQLRKEHITILKEP